MFNHIPFISLITALLLFLTAELTTAQSIKGRVLDAQTKSPLVGATVKQVDSDQGTSTNTTGEFELTLESGVRRLSISYIGYKTVELNVGNVNRTLEIKMVPETYIGEEVFVKGSRASDSTPMSFTNVNREELAERNLGQDVPYLLRATPSVVTTSDAGAGIGYTGIRIRGVDPARINVTINGIPVNDAESHGVFWVDLPDIISSVENIQIQRGVGTSTNGAGAFGGSINLQTSNNRVDPFAEVNTGVGSFNTRKANIQLGSGLMNNGWQFEGRLSKILSDGFIDRASSDLNSFYLSGSKRGDRSLLKADVFSGKERTYQAWYGVEESVLDSGNRTFNEAGTEKEGSPYEDQVDNYRQDYYQLHYYYQLSDEWSANASLHYTKGEGYYEEYKGDEDLVDYDIQPSSDALSTSDLVRRRWLDNDFYGIVFGSQYQSEKDWKLTIGGGLNKYDGDHFGEVIWARFAGESENSDRYYFNNGTKTDMNLYAKYELPLSDAFNTYLDLQVRRINYEFQGLLNDDTNGITNVDETDELIFFNPKAGVVYQKDNHRLYASVGVASKEPTRDEYVNSSTQSRPKAETLYNLESGYRGEFNKTYLSVGFYGMYYKDQLVLTGAVNDVGQYIRQNIPTSYRVGVELEGGVQLSDSWNWAVNATFSQNKIENFTEYIDDYDNGGQFIRNYNQTSIAFSPDLITSSILNFNQKGFNVELNSKYISRQYLDNTENTARSIDAYLVNDLLMSYTFSQFDFLQALTANLMINNILDKEYATNGYTFGFIAGGEQRFNYYYPQAGRNFLLQLKWSF